MQISDFSAGGDVGSSMSNRNDDARPKSLMSGWVTF